MAYLPSSSPCEYPDPVLVDFDYGSSDTEFFTLAEAFNFLKIEPPLTEDGEIDTDNEEVKLVQKFTVAAKEYVERYTGVLIGEREISMLVNGVYNAYTLPYVAMGDIAIERTISGTESEPVTDFEYDGVYGLSFPITYTVSTGRNYRNISISYQAGTSDVPVSLQVIGMDIMAALYECRGRKTIEGLINTGRLDVKTDLQPFKRKVVFN